MDKTLVKYENSTGKHHEKSSRYGSTSNKNEKSRIRANAAAKTSTVKLPIGDRGVELTFAETGHIKVFMMVRGNAFIQLDGDAIPTFQLR